MHSIWDRRNFGDSTTHVVHDVHAKGDNSMLRFLSAGSIERELDRGRCTGRRSRPGAARRRGSHPDLELLETRITPSTMTWTGATNGDWMTAGNWSSDTVPQAGDDLVFPPAPTSSNFVVVNNFPANTQFNSITIEASTYSLSGNPIDVATEVAATYSSGSSNDAIATDLIGGTVSVATGGTLNMEGAISGSAGLSLSGGGTFDLSGTNTYSGQTLVSDATLLVDGTTGTVLDSGVLGGDGTVGNVSSVGGTISPGDGGSPVVLNTGILNLDSNSSFVTELDGTSPGNGATGYDQVVASGTVSLGGATLDATLGTNYVPTVGSQYTIISNTSGPISGTFAGLTEGSTVVISGFDFSISYKGGSSSEDVVLTALPFPTTTSISATASTSTYGQSVAFTADVSGSQNNAFGQVAFFDGNPASGGTQLGVVALSSGDQASFATTSLNVTGSPHQIYAEYLPSASSEYGTSTTTQPVSVTITPATLTASLVGTISKQYDTTTSATVSSDDFQLSGVVGDNVVSVAPGVATYNTADVGTGETVTVTGLTLAGADASNFVLANGTVSAPVGAITPAPLAVSGITASNKIYDGTTSATINTSGATISGVLDSDDVSLVTSGAVGRFASKNVGPGMTVLVSGLTLTGTDAGNYTVSPPPEATASITPAPLTVTASPATMTYGGALPTLTDTVTGLVGADTVSSALTGALVTTATSSAPVGKYPITQGTLAAVDGNYTITFNPATLSITPALLTITANDVSKVYGAAVPALTASYSGFVNGNTAASLTTPPTLTTPATSSSAIGTYAINVGGASSSNYTITYVPGTLTIARASSSIAASAVLSGVVTGQIETFNATVLPLSPGNTGKPTGDVTFLVDGTPIATVPVDPATGHVSFSTSSIALGSHTVTATYSGDSNFAPSQSPPSSLLVTIAGTQTTLTAGAVRNKRGKIVDVILESQVRPVLPGGGVPTGVVTYYRKSHLVASEALVDGSASLTLKAAKALNKGFTVDYSGDTEYDASASAKVTPTKKSLKASARPLTAFFKRG
jgi:MBG domain (YGX type)/YDG domain/Bacterial Ig-like domain (group 3)